MYRILDDVRVLDLSRYISGPSCCRILADMGAEVIKVEKAGHGDEGRFCGPMANGSSLYFPAYNRNKKSITVDFRSENGKELLRRLIAKSDVVVENFKTGTMAAMGLGYEEMKKINPRIILVSITGFGQVGPDSKRPAYDEIVSCRSHLFAATGNGHDGKYCIGPNLMSDTVAGMNAATCVLLALYDRNKTGVGQWIDYCMLTSSAGAQPLAMADYAMNGEHDAYFIDAPNGVFETKDGFFQFTVGPQPMFMRFREVIDDPIVKDEKYFDVKKRIEDYELLCKCINNWTKKFTSDELDKVLADNAVAGGRVCTWQDVLTDRQLLYRDDIMHLPVENCGTVPYVKYPAKFSGHEYIEDTPAPALGADNGSVLSSLLGMTAEEIEKYTK